MNDAKVIAMISDLSHNADKALCEEFEVNSVYDAYLDGVIPARSIIAAWEDDTYEEEEDPSDVA